MKVLKILFFCLLLPVAVIAADVPRLKLVVTSDIHGQWKILEKVYAFAAGKNPDAVLFCGDLAIRHGDADSYKTYISLFKKHFSKSNKMPAHIVIPGNHDFWAPKGQKRLSAQKSAERFFGTMGMKNEWLRHTEVNGYSIIAVSATDEKGENSHTPAEIKQVSDLIGKAEKAAPGKPVFVLSHCPPAFTMSGSSWKKKSPKSRGWYWRYDLIREMLKGHKQAVSLSGHTHVTLHDERAIWQGDFTAISAGVLPHAGFVMAGQNARPFQPRVRSNRYAGAFIYIEVFDKYMLVYRYNATNMKEIKAENRWRIDLPYDPAKAVYTDKRFKESTAPHFPAGAKAEIVCVKGRYYLRLDRAEHADMVYSYKVNLSFDDKKIKAQTFYLISDFVLPRKSKRALLEIPAAVKLQAGAAGTMEISPVESFGKHGKSITAKFVIPAVKTKK